MNLLGLAVAAILTTSTPVIDTAADQLAAARDLYAGADYADALAILERLREESAAGPDEHSLSIEQYRALCLLALGRTAAAERAVEAMVVAMPAYRPASADIPPRFQATFTQVRRRTLPTIVQQTFLDARKDYDQRDYDAAIAGFKNVLALLDDADLAAAGGQAPLSDLRMLSAAFIDLSAGALASARAPMPVAAPEAARIAAAAPNAAAIYTADSRAVPPVVIKQTLPAYSGSLKSLTGVIEVTIDEQGAVTAARLPKPTHTAYDGLALAAARSWRYQAAVVEGVPVKYRKLVNFTIAAAK